MSRILMMAVGTERETDELVGTPVGAGVDGEVQVEIADWEK